MTCVCPGVGTGTLHLPRSAFSMNGAGGQYVIIDPENDLVIVTFHHRLGGVTGEAVRSLVSCQAIDPCLRCAGRWLTACFVF